MLATFLSAIVSNVMQFGFPVHHPDAHWNLDAIKPAHRLQSGSSRCTA